jgi:hypothetical protein
MMWKVFEGVGVRERREEVEGGLFFFLLPLRASMELGLLFSFLPPLSLSQSSLCSHLNLPPAGASEPGAAPRGGPGARHVPFFEVLSGKRERKRGREPNRWPWRREKAKRRPMNRCSSLAFSPAC